MKTLFLGGDIRQYYASEYLKKRGMDSKALLKFNINTEIETLINEAEYIIFPLPILKDRIYLNMPEATKVELKEILKIINFNKSIIAGMVPEYLEGYSDYKKHKFIDYYREEKFTIYNAYLSAEGAIFYAKQRMQKSIYNSKIAIIGYGRIGKMLSHMLKAQGAQIYVFTRKELDRTWSCLAGFKSQEIENIGEIIVLQDIDIIFNTVPMQILNEDVIKKISVDTLIIDIASYPYGMDKNLSDKYCIKYFREIGIPGRYAPQSAGEVLGKTVLNIIERRN